jgi:hypothetical protein
MQDSFVSMRVHNLPQFDGPVWLVEGAILKKLQFNPMHS